MQRPSAPLPNDELLRFLARQPLFADLPPADLAPLAAVVRRRHYARGAVIFTQGDLGSVAFIVRSGRVEIVVESADGRDLVLYEVGPGDHFGEMALIDPEPRCATVLAITDVELLVVRREDFLRELLKHPPAMLRMLASLSQRLRTTDAQVAGLAFDDTAARLSRFLSLNAAPRGRNLAVEVTQSELATMVGATRQTVARILGTWRRAGLIQTGRRRTVVLQPERLARLWPDPA